MPLIVPSCILAPWVVSIRLFPHIGIGSFNLHQPRLIGNHSRHHVPKGTNGWILVHSSGHSFKVPQLIEMSAEFGTVPKDKPFVFRTKQGIDCPAICPNSIGFPLLRGYSFCSCPLFLNQPVDKAANTSEDKTQRAADKDTE